MQDIKADITKLFQQYSDLPVKNIDKIPQSGSDRTYYRITCQDNEANSKQTYIATYGRNIKENGTFINFSRHFKKTGSPVPLIYIENDEQTLYIQEDFGDISLMNQLEIHGPDDYVYTLFQKSLKALAHMQINGSEGLNYKWCITSRKFGKQAIISDLLYFKYYFLDTLQIPYDKEKLIDDFDAMSTYLSHVGHQYFMFRDFQSRNVMIKDEEVHFIDYQGGMKGALQYDVASLLWQAKAELTDQWKNDLLEYYMTCVEDILQEPIDHLRFISQYNGYVLIRLLQVMGAYGFRGLFERKAHFLTSIPLALRNIKWFISNKQLGISLPEFERLLHLMTDDQVIHRFEPIRANATTPLVVKINSFSYLKAGYPKDETGNGGGFVFDCRGILNPGRIEEFKQQTGRDKPVQDYLEQQTKMPDFLNSIYNIVDIAVEDYIKRGFDSLVINFGCTGGQHRSVYAADAVLRHLRNKFGVKIELHHIEQHIHETKN